MASGPITSWQIDVETVEMFGGFLIPADGDSAGPKAITTLSSEPRTEVTEFL